MDPGFGRCVWLPARPGSECLRISLLSAILRLGVVTQTNNLDEDLTVTQNLEIKLRSTSSMLEWLDTELVTQQKRVEAFVADILSEKTTS